jgi:ribosomal protein S18 acetylase RimI-like enzyme
VHRPSGRPDDVDLVLRRCTPEDDAVLLGWIPDAEALHHFTGRLLSWPPRLTDLAALQRAEGRTAWALVDARRPQEALGHVEMTVDGAAARLSRVLLAPARRGRGWGRRLVSLAVEEARRRGAHEVGLNVVRGNAPALRTYRALGFTPLPEQPRADVVAMVLRLP